MSITTDESVLVISLMQPKKHSKNLEIYMWGVVKYGTVDITYTLLIYS